MKQKSKKESEKSKCKLILPFLGIDLPGQGVLTDDASLLRRLLLACLLVVT